MLEDDRARADEQARQSTSATDHPDREGALDHGEPRADVPERFRGPRMAKLVDQLDTEMTARGAGQAEA
jgi:hypothetical protein